MEILTKKAMQDASLTEMTPPASVTNTWSFAVAGLLAAFYFATTLYISSHRPLWTDEILTVDIAQLPDYRAIWGAVTHGVDGGSPVYDAMVRISGKVFGDSDLAARLPSALAMVAGMLIVFDCARRLTDNLHGLVAIAVLTCSFLPYYGHEARAYTTYFMLAALSLWVWVHAPDAKRSSAVLFGAVIFMAVAMHYYAVLLLAPYALWEAIRWKPWRLPSAKLTAGILGAVAALALFAPAIRSFAPVATVYTRIAPASLDGLRAMFPTLFPDGLWVVAVIAIWIALTAPTGDGVNLQPMSAGETVGWLFLCLPLAGFVVAKVTSSAFLGRYFISVLPGVAVAASCCLWRCFRGVPRVAIGVILILSTFGVAKQVMATRHPGLNAPIPHNARMEDTLRNDGKRFFVVCNQARYLEARHYSKDPEAYAYVPSLDSGDLHQTMALARYYSMQFWTLEDLKEHAREAAIIWPTVRVLNMLKQAGFEVEVRASTPPGVVYLK